MEKYSYQVSTYVSESPTFEGIIWMQHTTITDIDEYETARRIYEEASDQLFHENSRNICRIAQARKSEKQALAQRGSSMHAETWERYDGNRKYWFHLALYVTLKRMNDETKRPSINV